MISFKSLPVVVKNLIIINVIMLLATYAFQSFGVDLISFFGLHYVKSELFYPHQIITYIFMHSKHGLSHILFNMLGLYMFGRVLEYKWGAKRFLTFYIFSGVGAGLIHILVTYLRLSFLKEGLSNMELEQVMNQGHLLLLDSKNYVNPVLSKINILLNIPTVGASGSLYGILLAYGLLFPNSEIMLLFPPVNLKAKWFVAIFGGIELFSGLADTNGDNVAHFAHLGGMLFGYLILIYWKRKYGSFH